MATTDIDHLGTIISIDDEIIRVKILSTTACSSCHAKGSCSASEVSEKIIDVANTPNSKHEIGDQVKVSIDLKAGNKAVLLGYLVPFLLVVLSLIICFSLKLGDGQSGLISLSSLLPYYLFLWIYKAKHSKMFNFKIKDEY